MPPWPGAEAHADRHARAAAIQMEQRSQNVHTFLEAHQLLDQAAAVLSSSDAPEYERTVAILQCATTAFSAVDLQPSSLNHPACLVEFDSGHTLALMMPFVRRCCSPGTGKVATFDVNNVLTFQQVASSTASPVRSVHTIARLLLLAWWFTAVELQCDGGPLQQAHRAAGMLAALPRSLQDEGRAQAMRAELARMQHASSAASNNSRVPALEQLLAAAAAQEMQYMHVI